MDEYKISSITLCTYIEDVEFNLYNTSKYLEIDDFILGIKYSNTDIRGIYKTCKKPKKIFNDNQVSIIVNYNNHNINVKLFKNGCLHMTGCKDINEGNGVGGILFEKFKKLESKYAMVILTRDLNNILLDKNDFIYSFTDTTISTVKQIGYKKDLYYYINGIKTVYYSEYNLFRTLKNVLYSFQGVPIGKIVVNIFDVKFSGKKKSNKNFRHVGNNVMYFDKIVGKISCVDFNGNNLNREQQCIKNLPLIVKAECCCSPLSDSFIETSSPRDIKTIVNNINIVFDIEKAFDRQELYNLLHSKNLLVIYNSPTKENPKPYNGIKLIFNVPILEDYSNFDYNSLLNTMTCNLNSFKVTFLIFNKKKVVCTGIKKIEMITPMITLFKTLLKNL